jgi:hypothetical protein
VRCCCGNVNRNLVGCDAMVTSVSVNMSLPSSSGSPRIVSDDLQDFTESKSGTRRVAVKYLFRFQISFCLGCLSYLLILLFYG